MNPLVSIIIPVYNKKPFVREAVDSALNQTYPFVEVILVNDGSTDGSWEILREYTVRYPEIVTLIDSENRGVSAATNLGIQAAKGEYIQFLDADDLMSSDKIERQIHLLSRKGGETIAICEWVNFKDDIHQYRRVPYGVFRDFGCGIDLLLRFWSHQEMHQPAVYLTHRDLIEKAGPWNESLTINQDGEFFCRVLSRASNVLYEPHGKVFYRQPGVGNVSQQKSQKAAESLLESYSLYEKSALAFEDSPRVREALKKVYQKFLYDIFPEYPELLEEARSRMKHLGVQKNTFIGGPKFRLLSKCIGFEGALRMKRWFG